MIQQKNHCPFCNSNDTIYYRKITSNKKEYYLYVCKNCKLNYFFPLTFENIYSNYTKMWGQTNENVQTHYWTDYLVNYLKKSNYKLLNKKILDIGAGNCINFVALKKNFNINTKDYYALDIDKKALDIGKKHGVKNTFNYLVDDQLTNKFKIKFDVICATEVLEHQTDLSKFLDVIFKLLKNKGLLIITVPNKDRIFMKYRESTIDVPPHHFLKFGKEFFIKNFPNIVVIEAFSDINASYKTTAQVLSKIVLKNQNYWPLFFMFVPIVKVFRCLCKHKGARLLVVLRKEK